MINILSGPEIHFFSAKYFFFFFFFVFSTECIGIAPDRGQSHILFFFYFSTKNIHCGYTLEAPQRGLLMSNHNICFNEEIRKIHHNLLITLLLGSIA